MASSLFAASKKLIVGKSMIGYCLLVCHGIICFQINPNLPDKIMHKLMKNMNTDFIGTTDAVTRHPSLARRMPTSKKKKYIHTLGQHYAAIVWFSV